MQITKCDCCKKEVIPDINCRDTFKSPLIRLSFQGLKYRYDSPERFTLQNNYKWDLCDSCWTKYFPTIKVSSDAPKTGEQELLESFSNVIGQMIDDKISEL